MPNKSHYTVAIIGSGPAGLTAAIYASRASLEPVVFKAFNPAASSRRRLRWRTTPVSSTAFRARS